MSVPLEVWQRATDDAGAALAAVAARARAVGTELETATLSPPLVGDLPTAAAFDQAHYGWTQTRFEDLTASADAVAGLARAIPAAGAKLLERDLEGADDLIAAATGTGAHQR